MDASRLPPLNSRPARFRRSVRPPHAGDRRAATGAGRRGHPCFLGVLALVGVLAACQAPGPQTSASRAGAVDTAAIRSSLDSLGGVVMRANQTGDAELFASTWAEDGIMSTPGTPPVRGRDSIVAAFRRRPALPPGATMTVHPTELQVMSENWAYAFGVDTIAYTPPGASEPVTETMTFLVLIRRTPDGWKTYREVLSADQPRSVLHP